MYLLLLTELTGNKIMVNAQEIDTVAKGDDGDSLVETKKAEFWVRETPEEIYAMLTGAQ